jgi:hypothetical protein
MMKRTSIGVPLRLEARTRRGLGGGTFLRRLLGGLRRRRRLLLELDASFLDGEGEVGRDRMHAQLALHQGDVASAFVALESHRAQVPAGLAAALGVLHERLDVRGLPDGLAHLALTHQGLRLEHGRPAGQVDQVVF